MPELPRITIPDHTLIRKIGEGGYGEIWLARSITGEHRAVKIVSCDLFEDDRPYEREFEGIQRYEPISRQHDGLVAVLHIGRDDTQRCLYYIMELADAEDATEDFDLQSYQARTLKGDIRKRGCLSLDDCLQVGEALARGLAALHEHKLIHRDIKPSNIVFVRGAAHLADPGLVATRGQEHSLVGTEGYLPPEGAGTEAADVYGLGKALYEASTGLDRNEFPTIPEAWRNHSNYSRYLEWNEILVKACDRDPSDRYGSMEGMLEDLQHLQAGGSIRRKRQRESWCQWLGRAAIVLAVLGLLAFAATRWRETASQVDQVKRERDDAQRDRLLKQSSDAIDDGDYATALLLQATALKYEAASVHDKRAQRIRAATLLQSMPFLQYLSARNSPIVLAEFAKGGQFSVTVWGDGVVEIRDVAHQSLVHSLRHEGGIVDGAVSGDGSRLLLLNSKGMVRIWDIATGKAVTDYLNHSDALFSGAMNRDGTIAVVAGSNQSLTCWRIQDDGRSRIIHYIVVGSRINAVEFGDATTIGVACADGSLRIYDALSSELTTRLDHSGGEVFSMSFVPGKRQIYTGSEDRRIRLWDTNREQPVSSFHFPSRNFRTVRLGPYSRFVLGLDYEDGFSIWHCASGVPKVAVFPRVRATIGAFSGDGRTIAIGDERGKVSLWNLVTGREIASSIRHSSAIAAIDFSEDGRRLLTADVSGACRHWELESGTSIRHELAHADDVTFVQFHPTQPIALTVSEDDTVQLWDVGAGRVLAAPLRHGGRVLTAAFSPDGETILTGGYDDHLRLWRTTDGKEISRLRHGGVIYDAKFDRSGTRVASCGADGIVKLWRVSESGIEWEATLAHEGEVVRLAFDPSTTYLAANSWDTGICAVWNLQSAPPQRSATIRLKAELEDIAFIDSRDPRLVITGWGGQVKVWDVAPEQKQVASLDHASTVVQQVYLDTPSNQMISIGLNGTAKIHHLDTLAESGPEQSYPGDLLSGRFSPTGDWIVATTDGPGGMQLREIDNGNALTSFFEENGAVRSVAVSVIGEETLILTGGNSGLAKIRNLRPWQGDSDALQSYSQVLSGQRFIDGHLQSFSDSKELAEAFASSHGLRQEWYRSWRLSDADWRRRAVAQCFQEGSWRAAVYHLDRAEGNDVAEQIATAREFESKWDQGGYAFPDHYPDIPPRSQDASADQLDLTAFYNGSLRRVWQGTHPVDRVPFRNDLAEMPIGLHLLAGYTFDLRGVIQLAGSTTANVGENFPEKVNAIPVGRVFHHLHALHAAAYSDEAPGAGPPLTYRLNYENGERVDVPVTMDQHIREWWQSDQPVPLPYAKIGWVGSTPRAELFNCPYLVLDIFSWENPYPDKVVLSIDLVSEMRVAAPFVVAITVE